jgi:hypothetical protein
MLNEPTSAEVGVLNKSSYLAPTLGVTKFTIVRFWSHFVVPLKSDLDGQ